MIHNYQEEISNFITTQLIPKINQSDNSKLTLSQVYGLITDVFPKKWIDITDVYDVLTQLGYSPIMDIDENGKFTSFYSFV